MKLGNAAASYVHHEDEDGSVSTRLVAAKSRLAPLKAMSIPRLELMGGQTGLRLTLTVLRQWRRVQERIRRVWSRRVLDLGKSGFNPQSEVY